MIYIENTETHTVECFDCPFENSIREILLSSADDMSSSYLTIHKDTTLCFTSAPSNPFI